MPHWKLTLAYDGSSFHGWQIQNVPNGPPTIQGTLAQALASLTAETVLPQGSGRTDAGVHALGQVTTFSLDAPIPAANLQRSLNRALPPSIRVLAVEEVPDTFHARYSATAKTYEYRIFESRLLLSTGDDQVPRVMSAGDNQVPRGFSLGSYSQPEKKGFSPGGLHSSKPAITDRICSPFLAPFVWDCHWPLNLVAMQGAADDFLGQHDFTSFAASDPDLSERNDPKSAPSPVRTITRSTLTRESNLLIYRVTGSGFLHHMVRNIVGTLVEIGRGALPADAIPSILAARDRSAAGPTAPASGLFLVSVDYESDSNASTAEAEAAP